MTEEIRPETEQDLLRQMEQLKQKREEALNQFCNDLYKVLSNAQLSAGQRATMLDDVMKIARAGADRYFSEVDLMEVVRSHVINEINASAKGEPWTDEDIRKMDRFVIDRLREMKLRDGNWRFDANWNTSPEAEPYLRATAEIAKAVETSPIPREIKQSFSEVLTHFSRRAGVGGLRETEAWVIKSSKDLILALFDDASGLSETELSPRAQYVRDEIQHLMKYWHEIGNKIQSLAAKVRQMRKS